MEGRSIRKCSVDLDPITLILDLDLMTLMLDFDPMTLILDLDLDILEMYLRTKNEIPRCQSFQKVRVRTGQTDATKRITTPHS